jgi:hypothetical protein
MSKQYLMEKWAPILAHPQADPIKDNYRAQVTAQLLENQEKFLREQNLMEAPVNSVGNGGYTNAATASGPVAGFDPVIISLVRRAMPNLIAYDLCGVQPMSGPTGLIFAQRARYVDGDNDQLGPEAFYNEADVQFSGDNGSYTGGGYPTEQNPGLINDATGGGTTAGAFDPTLASDATAFAVNQTRGLTGSGLTTAELEALGSDAGNAFREMAFSIEKVAVAAKGRALKAQYSLELAQDLRAVHGLDAEAELANILSSEILAEINREIIRTIYHTAKPGAQNNTTNAGVFDLDLDSNGRWSVEKFKGLLFQIERDANAIAQQTRRGKGNVIICSADVASALTMAGVLDYTPALNANLNVDDTGNLLAGTINGKIKVYIDPYMANVANDHYYVIGYKGSNFTDAGLFYAPYVPLQMLRAVDPNTFQPAIAFKTRYGFVANPYAEGATAGGGRITANSNVYYRRTRIRNLM